MKMNQLGNNQYRYKVTEAGIRKTHMHIEHIKENKQN
jgi:hypothetical protein